MGKFRQFLTVLSVRDRIMAGYYRFTFLLKLSLAMQPFKLFTKAVLILIACNKLMLLTLSILGKKFSRQFKIFLY